MSSSASQDKKLGQILLEQGYITSEQLAEAMAAQVQLNATQPRKFKVGEILLFQGVIKMSQLHEALRSQTGKAEKSRKELEAIKERATLLESFGQNTVSKKPRSNKGTEPDEPRKSFMHKIFKR